MVFFSSYRLAIDQGDVGRGKANNNKGQDKQLHVLSLRSIGGHGLGHRIDREEHCRTARTSF